MENNIGAIRKDVEKENGITDAIRETRVINPPERIDIPGEITNPGKEEIHRDAIDKMVNEGGNKNSIRDTTILKNIKTGKRYKMATRRSFYKSSCTENRFT